MVRATPLPPHRERAFARADRFTGGEAARRRRYLSLNTRPPDLPAPVPFWAAKITIAMVGRRGHGWGRRDRRVTSVAADGCGLVESGLRQRSGGKGPCRTTLGNQLTETRTGAWTRPLASPTESGARAWGHSVALVWRASVRGRGTRATAVHVSVVVVAGGPPAGGQKVAGRCAKQLQLGRHARRGGPAGLT